VDKFVVSGSVSQANVFGSGKFLSLAVNSGKVNRTYSISYLNPYFTVDGLGQGFDLYSRRVDASSLAVGAYRTDSLGGGVKFSYPVSESDSISVGLAAENVELGLQNNSPLTYKNFVNTFGTQYTYGYATLGWGRERRDSAIMPTRGSLTRVSAELAGGDLQYYRINLNEMWYYPLSRNVTLNLMADLGYVNGFSNKEVPFFKNFYAGGPGSVRGYRAFSLGPQDVESNVLGGTRKLVGSAEVLFPMPGAQADKSLRLSTFIDAGQVFGAGQKVEFGEFRYAAGLGLYWTSPFGPLRLSVAQPLNAKSGFDRVERLQFTFGSVF
jgi:outer membrane protein insertion porin family